MEINPMPIKLRYESDESGTDPVNTIEMVLCEHVSIDEACLSFKQFLSACGYGINVEDEIELVKAHQSSDEKEFLSRVRARFEEEEEEEVEDSWGESITAMDREEQIKYSSEYDEDEKYHIHMGNLQLGLVDQPNDKLVQAYDKMNDPAGVSSRMADPDYVGREYAEYIKGVRDPDTCTRCKCGEGK